MAITVKYNATIDGAFQVYIEALSVSKQRPMSAVITDAGNKGTREGTAFTITGNLTFAVDSVRGVGVDLKEWENADNGRLIEYDRGPQHVILRNCKISNVADSGNPGGGQRSIAVSFIAETDDEI